MGLVRQCPECGKQYPSKARFCRKDGAKLVEATVPTPIEDPSDSAIDAEPLIEPSQVGPLGPLGPQPRSTPALPGLPSRLAKPGPAAREPVVSSVRETKPAPGGRDPERGPARSDKLLSLGDLATVPDDGAGGPPTVVEPGLAADRTAELPPVAGPGRRAQKDPPKDPMIGRIVAGRFQLEQFLGSGATGVVYRATHKALNRPMAVKLLKRELIWDERSLLRFLREARACSVMDHPNIVYLYDYGRDDDGAPYLVMEYVDGVTLHAAIQQSPTGTLLVERVVPILLQVARALAHAHQKGVVHRDIKPENIVLTRQNEQDDWVKVLDFGVARIVGHQPITGHGQVTGTAEFIAPETLAEDDQVAPPVDLYALGIIFHEALVGRPPFTGPLDVVLHQHLMAVPPLLSERCGDPSLPLDLDLVVARLLEKDPAHRPTAAELVVELEQILVQLSRGPAEAAPLSEHATQRLTVYQRPTSILLPAERKTSMVDRSGRRTQVVDRQSWPTQLMPHLVHHAPTRWQPGRAIDPADARRERESAMLFEQASSLAALIWPGVWPQALSNLRGHIADCDRVEQELEEQLRVLEKHQREQAQVQERHQQLRQGIIALSERLQTDHSLGTAERERLLTELEELERGFFATEARWRSQTEAVPEPLRQRLVEVRGDRQRARALFARLLIEMPCPPVLAGERERVIELLKQFEAADKAPPPQ
jgi:serine/threonine protein kinase